MEGNVPPPEGGGGYGSRTFKKSKHKRKKNKGQDVSNPGGCAGEPQGSVDHADQSFNKHVTSTPTRGGGNAARNTLLPKPGSQEQGRQQLVVNVDRGNRNVSHVYLQESPAASSKSRDGQQQYRQNSTDSNANSNANNNAKYRDKGKAKGDKKIKQNRQQEKEPAASHKGSLVSLEGKELLRKLAEHRIFELKKKNPSFPNAKYFCRLCEYHLDRPLDCERHVDENRHQRKKEALDMEGILENIPPPSRQQIRALDGIVSSVAQEEGLSLPEIQARQDIFCRLQAFIHKFKDDVTLRLYGSSLTGVGLKNSDVNVDVSGPGPAPALLMNVFNIMQQHGAPDFVNAQSNFSAKIPVVIVTDSQTACDLVLTINGQAAVLDSSLLQLYSLADPRVNPLSVTFRTWAKICHLDRQEEGTLPAFAYNVMVVYFLLQTEPPVLCLLPLQKNPPEGKGIPPLKMEDKLDTEALKSKAETWQSKNKSSIGQLWLQLLRFYCLEFDNTQFVISLLDREPLTRMEKKWNSKKLAIEDPFNIKKNIANSLANSLIFEYYQSCVRKAYEYFGMPRDKDGNVNVCLEALRALASQKTEILLNENQDAPSTSVSSSSVETSDRDTQTKEKVAEKVDESDEKDRSDAELEESEVENGQPVVIKSNKTILEKLTALASKDSPNRPASTENSVSPSPTGGENSVSLSLTGDAEVSPSDIPVSAEGKASAEPSNETSTGEDHADSSAALSSSEPLRDSAGRALSASDLELTVDSVPGSASGCLPPSELNMTVDSAASVSSQSAQNESETSREYFTAAEVAEGVSSDDYETSPESPEEAAESDSALSREMGGLSMGETGADQQTEAPTGDAQPQADTAPDEDEDARGVDWYIFTENVFTGGKGPAVICGYCEQEGHIKANCPEDKLPPLLPLPHMTREHLTLLNQVIRQIIYDFAPSEADIRRRHRVVKDLENFVQQIYPDAKFSLFGSSCNGFGFRLSDLDICMTFRGKTVEDIDVVDVIEKVAKKLNQKNRQYLSVVPIPTAKVPIVKFMEGETRLEGDISLYNTLAQCNTRLLWCYSQIDERVKILGYAVKVFAKICDIGDASRGSLSSYGYILMMLHYLQQCRPPVIPVLQELRSEGEHPEHIVEGCNTWFFDDLRRLPQVWRESGKNRQDLAELWLGFLRYYMERFDWRTMVVSIRQMAPLSKFEKMWNGNNIAVEDPFDLNHNLGGGLSRKMNNYIFKTFAIGRLHFGTPFHHKRDIIHRYRNPSEYFFDPKLLMDGKPPNDRGCRLCGKIGHMVKDCPNRSQNRKRQQNQNDKDTKEASSQQDKSNQKKTSKETKDQAQAQGQSNTQGKGQNKEGKGQGNKKEDKDVKKQGDAQVKSQKEGKEPRPKSAEGQDKQVESRSGQDRGGKGQGSRQNQVQPTESAGGKDSGPASSEERKGSEKRERSHPVQTAPRVKAATTSAANSGVPTTSTSITTTAATSLATTTTSSGNISRVPPAFSSTPQRLLSQTEGTPHSGVLPSPVQGSPSVQSRPVTSTHAQPMSPGLHPPGVQMDLQQLFTLAQRSGSQSMSLSPQEGRKQEPLAPGLHPSQLALTPEQQVALLGAQSPHKAVQSTSSAPVSGSSHSPRGPPDSQMTQVPVTALFQAQSPTSPGQLPPRFVSLQPGTPLPLQTLFPARPPPQQVSVSPSVSQTPPSCSGPTAVSMMSPTHSMPGPPQRMPLPLKSLFSSSPPVRQVSTISIASSASDPQTPSTWNVPTTSPQQMTPLPLKALFSSQSPRPSVGAPRGPDPRPEHHPKQPVSLRFLFQATSSQQQKQQMMLQQQQAQQSQAQHQYHQAQQQFMHSFMQKFQEQKPTGGIPGTPSATLQHSAAGGGLSPPPGFQSITSHPQPMTSVASFHHQYLPQHVQLQQNQPDRSGHQSSPEKAHDPRQPQGAASSQNAPTALSEPQPSAPHLQPALLQKHTSATQHSMLPFVQMVPAQSPLVSPAPMPPVVHSYQRMVSPGQPLSSSPLPIMQQTQGTPPPQQPPTPPSISSQPPHPTHPSSMPGLPPHPMPPMFSQPMVLLSQTNQPVVAQIPGDAASQVSSWPQVVSSGADAFAMPQQLAFIQQQQQQILQQQMAAVSQGMVSVGQALPGQAAPGMASLPHFQMGQATQTIKRERQNSCGSNPDTTG